MGFRKEATQYKLRFEDPDLDGLEVIAKSLPLRDFLAIKSSLLPLTIMRKSRSSSPRSC